MAAGKSDPEIKDLFPDFSNRKHQQLDGRPTETEPVSRETKVSPMAPWSSSAEEQLHTRVSVT